MAMLALVLLWVGDLILLIGRMLRLSGLDTVRVTEVKGHADEDMVREGGVRQLDRIGNSAADEADDFGRRRVDFAVIDACRNFAGFVASGLSPGLWLVIRMGMVLHLIRWSGLLVLFLSDVG